MSKYTEHLDQYKLLHSQCEYGKSSEKLYENILPLVKEINPISILDYGCGNSKLIDMLPAKEKCRYDPAIPQYEICSRGSFDLILCTDVLEHIPEKYIDNILKHLFDLSNKVIFSIALKQATICLPNGENAHCTLKPIEWWLQKIENIFDQVMFVENIRDVKFIVKTWNK